VRSDAGVADWRRRRSGWHLVARSRGQARISDGRVEKDVKVQDADGTAAVGRRMLRDVKERLLGGDGASGLHREEPRYPRGSFRRRVERSSRPPRRRCCCGRNEASRAGPGGSARRLLRFVHPSSLVEGRPGARPLEKAEVELEHDEREPRYRVAWRSERLAVGPGLTAQIPPKHESAALDRRV